MAIADVYNMAGQKVSEIDLSEEVFNVPVKSHVLHEVVRMQLNKRRAGTASTKTRAEVSGGGRKPYRQKGTGRARAGSRTSPLWRKGGVIFGPKPRSYAYKVPKKVRQSALKMALSSKAQENTLTIVDRLEMASVKTKSFVEIMKALGLEKALFITDAKNDNVELSCRNLPYAKVLRCDGLNVYDILRYKNLVLVEPSVKQIQERLLP
jgi:large subunit ribosomal protein L4